MTASAHAASSNCGCSKRMLLNAFITTTIIGSVSRVQSPIGPDLLYDRIQMDSLTKMTGSHLWPGDTLTRP